MTQPTRPHPQGTDILSAGAEHFRIGRAAEILQCDPHDLLHLGSVGKVEIIAPVVFPGVFRWPMGTAGMYFPEVDGPVAVSFNAADRVILSAFDLAKIEAVGWTIPQFFYAPAAARRVVDTAALFLSAPAKHDEMEQQLRETRLYSRWDPVGQDVGIQNSDGDFEDVSTYVAPVYDPQIVTKIEHLFLFKTEVQRLIEGLPQDDFAAARGKADRQVSEIKNSGYSDRHASNREPMWRAAVYCLGSMVQPKIVTNDLIAKIEIELNRYRSDKPLLSVKQMKAFLSRTLKGDLSNPK